MLAIGEACRKRSIGRSDSRCRVAPIAESNGERRVGANVADFAALNDVAHIPCR
jgi:hypothetical protein